MKTSVLRIAVLGLLVAALAVAPERAFGQETTKPPAAAEKAKDGVKKKGGAPLGGRINAVDKTAKTIKVGNSVVHVTSQTRITKAGKPAVFDDAVVGEEVGIYYVKGEDGKLTARSVRIGPRPEGDKKQKKSKEVQ